METEKILPAGKTPPPFAGGEEIKKFYKKDLSGILKKIWLEPVNGTYALFTAAPGRNFSQSLILMASSAVLCAIFVFLSIPSVIRQYAPVTSIMAKSALFTVVFLMLVSLISFVIKSISGKANFKNELFTGALCGIPFSALVILLFLFSKFVMNEQMLSGLSFGGYSEVISKAGIFLLFIFYILLQCINILMQSLRASGTRDAIAWYLAPAGVFLAFYLTLKIVLM